ncbi:MAG: glycoside hydrolase family 127 protein [Sedimentisphaerales bacterium]|nr:glycoside hydrolase family 127 protein [Sedimentisphaerales bacterium]
MSVCRISAILLIVSLICLGCLSSNARTGPALSIEIVKTPPTTVPNDFYVSNRPPLTPSPFMPLPIGAIEPKGWVRKQLRLQADGFHGRLTEISKFLEKQGNAWLSPAGEGDHGWEEPPYWLKGFGNCAYILRDEKMIAEAKIWIEAALASGKPDGWFGPDKGRGGIATRLQGREDLWPNMIMLFCLQDYYSFTGDERVIELMTNYMKYLQTVPEDKFLVGYWPKMRGGDLLYSVYWLYNRTGDKALLELAKKVHRTTAKWQDDVINWHNVNMSQGFGEPATYYMQSKNPVHLNAAERNWQKIRDSFGQVPGGMFGGDENCRKGYTGPRQAVETCGMVEMMLSHETLLTISGDVIWADRCEDVAFNSLPAAFTPDLKALHYLTSPNMVLCDRNNKSPGLQNGGPMLLFDPHDHRCCQHNAGHGWPYYAAHLWLAAPANGLAAVLYAPSVVTAKVGPGAEVKILQETKYPFEDKIGFTVTAPEPVEFPLYLRIPNWCQSPAVTIAGKTTAVGPDAAGKYLKLARKWKNGDKFTLTLPMQIKIRKWTKNFDSVSVDRGPLTYSLRIGEKYVRRGGTEKWPAWEIHPTTPWNYGLILDEQNPEKSFRFAENAWPDDDQPFRANAAPLALTAKAKKIPQWQLDNLGLCAEIQQSPVFSDQPEETVTLIPMGCARLRISAFPTIGAGPDANKWKAPPKPAKPIPTTASHCWPPDTLDACSDKLLPHSSNDHDIPRMTFWDHKGTAEWIQYNLEKPVKISAADVYFFDDTGVGSCRIPQSWRLLYDDAGQLKPVPNPSKFTTEKDKFNKVTFDPIETDKLRMELNLRENVSAGILEWRINPPKD